MWSWKLRVHANHEVSEELTAQWNPIKECRTILCDRCGMCAQRHHMPSRHSWGRWGEISTARPPQARKPRGAGRRGHGYQEGVLCTEQECQSSWHLHVILIVMGRLAELANSANSGIYASRLLSNPGNTASWLALAGLLHRVCSSFSTRWAGSAPACAGLLSKPLFLQVI